MGMRIEIKTMANFDVSGLYLAGGRIWAYLKTAFEASPRWRVEL
jgi:hypothetical protein